MGKLFGTDGIRGIANQHPITPEMAVNIGRIAASVMKRNTHRPKIIIGMDTRISGGMIASALASGICSAGVDAYMAGIVPTPAVAFLTASMEADAGVVVSASHNPFYDNGIKLFQADGFKLSDEKEIEIERLLLSKQSHAQGDPTRETGRIFEITDALDRYRTFLEQSLDAARPFQGVKVVLDCANGATYQAAPRLFTELGADTSTICNHPDGININHDCGSQYTEKLRKTVLDTGADVGLAFDGDGDRLVAVDDKGVEVRGDRILYICARSMKRLGKLKNDLVVSTVMSNIGLTLALNDLGIRHVLTEVGDRYVMQEMVRSGAVLGGEDSGHIIFLDRQTTGDGIYSALRLLSALRMESRPLSELAQMMTVSPQILINVEVGRKPELDQVEAIRQAIHRVESELGEKGRVLVRYSGTQPLCRVMVEGPTLSETRRQCEYLSEVIKNELSP